MVRPRNTATTPVRPATKIKTIIAKTATSPAATFTKKTPPETDNQKKPPAKKIKSTVIIKKAKTAATATTTSANRPPVTHDQYQPAKKFKYLTRKQGNALLIDSGEAVKKALTDLEVAAELSARAGLSIDSAIVANEITVPDVWDPNKLPTVLRSNLTTGGHSNTDHVVVRTGNERKDRIAELKRNLLRRSRAMQPENKGEDRWDKPRIPGERRRRIVREKDSPEAPPEPPPSGYVVFVGQMTTKIRHDRPNVRHDQTKGKAAWCTSASSSATNGK
jgi:hypothetical protein